MVYCTPEDTLRESEVAKEIEAKYPNVTVTRIPAPFAEVDWVIAERESKRVIAIAEVKCRDHDLGAFPTVWFPLSKWFAMFRWGEAFHAPGIFFVRYRDRLAHIRHEKIHDFEVSILGAGDRAIREPIIQIPIEALTCE